MGSGMNFPRRGSSNWHLSPVHGNGGAMNRISHGLRVSGVILALALLLGGCGSSDDEFPIITVTILSDQAGDGDIAFQAPSTYIATNGPPTVFFGLDDTLREFRAFLDFPLDGSNGFEAIPLNAYIESASLIVRIVSLDFATSVPTLLDLVSYTPGALGSIDWSSTPLATRSAFPLLASDVGQDVEIDVTSLMREAQVQALNDFQVRFMLDIVPGADGLVGLDDQPTVAATAPTLVVRFR